MTARVLCSDTLVLCPRVSIAPQLDMLLDAEHIGQSLIRWVPWKRTLVPGRNF